MNYPFKLCKGVQPVIWFSLMFWLFLIAQLTLWLMEACRCIWEKPASLSTSCALRSGQNWINFISVPGLNTALWHEVPQQPQHINISDSYLNFSLSFSLVLFVWDGSKQIGLRVGLYIQVFTHLKFYEISLSPSTLLGVKLWWLLGLVFYVLISVWKIHFRHSVRPNPSHLCNIELANVSPLIFYYWAHRLREQDLYHLVSPKPGRERGTPIPIRESVKRGKQPGAVVPDTHLPNSGSDAVTLL